MFFSAAAFKKSFLFKFKKNAVSREIVSIQLLRGVASAMVCYFHLSNGNKNFLPDSSYIKQAGVWGWSGVEVFFLISGFVIPFSMYSKNYDIKYFYTFLKKRVIRIEPPYLISIILIILLNYLSTISPYYRGTGFNINWLNLAGHLAYINGITGGKWLNDVYWSLAIEFQYYIIIAIAYKLIISKNMFYRFLFMVLFLASNFITIPLNGLIFSYSTFFVLGIILFQVQNGIINNSEFLILLLFSLITIFIKYGWVMNFISISAILIIIFIDRIPKFFKYLGMISYSLYLIHIPIGGRIINLSEVLLSNKLVRETMVFLAFAVSVMISWFFYLYIEKPCKKMAGSIQYNSKKRYLNTAK